MLLSITEFVGHFHPAVVHLPVGILLLAVVLMWLSKKEKYQTFRGAVPFVLFWGCVSALLSCISGYLLSISDDYDENLVGWHKWMGIAVFAVSLLLYLREKEIFTFVNKIFLSVILFVLVFVTGHIGGSLTHGSDYFSKPLKDAFSNDSAVSGTIKPVLNVEEAVAYNEVIKPILETKCYSCHNANKQKGGLRMDDTLLLMKGGKDELAIVTGKPDESEMIKRLLLPVDNDDHMPPKEKPQLTEQQIALIHWWISNGNDFTKKVKDIPQPEKIKAVLLSLQQVPEIKKETIDLPTTPVEKADDKIVAQLKEKNIVVLPVDQNSNYLLVNFVTHNAIDKDDLRLLQKMKKQLVWLKMDNSNITDEGLREIGTLTSLRRLHLSNTNISDKGVSELKNLDELVYLNLVGTEVSLQGILALKGLKRLQSIYLYKTNVGAADWSKIKKEFPKTQVDSGGYQVPTLTTDTTLVKTGEKY